MEEDLRKLNIRRWKVDALEIEDWKVIIEQTTDLMDFRDKIKIINIFVHIILQIT